MTTTYLPFGSNNIPVYAYEGFDFTILNSVGSTVSSTNGLKPDTLYFTTDTSGNVRFNVSGSASTLVPSTNKETFTLTSNGLTSVNTVTINGGRFLDGSGVTLSNNSYTFYRNETISPIKLVAPFNVNTPTSIPALPPGLTFVRDTSSVFNISGTPLVVVPNSNYQIIGVQSNGSKVVTTRFNMAISNERLRMNLSGSPTISGMQVGIPIATRVITAVPPVGSSTVRYTFSVLPDGIYVQDICGTVYPSNTTTFTPPITDPSYTMIIAGAPSLKAAESFRDAGFTDNKGRTYTIQGSRTVPLPIVENKIDISFAFQETILFDTPVISNNYTGIPIVSNSNYFGAKTYFTASNSPISNIFSPDLVSDLSLVFDTSLSRAYLTGTTSVAGTKNFKVTAVNANTNSNDLLASVTIFNDTVSFSSPVADSCYNFILSRPLTQFKTGYYESNIQFAATSSSGRPITFSAPALAGTGLSLDGIGTLTGIPTAITPLTNLVVTASTGTTSATRPVKFAVLDDVITLGNLPTFNFVQNIPITPFQIPIQPTLSGRSVIDYFETNLPNGLSISPAGVISGTCLSSDTCGTITITATTGFASGSNTYTFTNQPDNILFTVPQDSYAYLAGQSIDPFYITGVAFSGTAVSNFVSGLPSSYGFLVSSNGYVSGTWSNSIPPNPVLPLSSNFTITAQAGGITGDLSVNLTASPVIQKTSFVWGTGGYLYKYNDISWSYVSNVTPSSGAFDIQLRTSNVDGNFILFTARDRIWKTTNTATFTSNTLGNFDVCGNVTSVYQNVSSLTPKPGTTTWWASGTRNLGGVQTSVVIRSDDNNVSWKPENVNVLQDSSGNRMLSRDSNAQSGDSNPYLCAGIALKYDAATSVLLAGGMYNDAGGPVMLRSTIGGLAWDRVNGEFAKECAYLNVDVSGMWIATGSDKYKTIDFTSSSWSGYGGGAANTIKYSTDAGSNWSNATGGFNIFGYELVYANNIWMATGVTEVDVSSSVTYTIGVKYSTNGSEWSNVDIFNGSNPYGVISNTGTEYLKVRAPLPIGSLQYDGSNWNVMVQRQDASNIWITEIRSAPAPTSTWTVTDVTNSFPEIANDGTRRFVSWTRPNYLRTGQTSQINIGLTFSTGIGNGPTITSPSTSAFLLYQYVPTTITVDGTGAGTVYFFINADELPPGLKFNPLTKTIYGKPVTQGYYVTRVFAKDVNGVTIITLNFTVNVPRIIRKQDGAGAYTSLLRQYTEVLGAQNARDNRVLPNQERRLGEFMSPVPSDVVTRPFSTLKCGKCGRTECPTILETIETGNAELNTCNFLDANGDGDIIDLGNADPDECG